MTTSTTNDDAFATFVQAARAWVAEQQGTPDFAAVVERARELDPELIPVQAVRQASEQQRAHDEMVSTASTDAAMSPRLAAFVGSAKRHGERLTIRRRLRGMPTLQTPTLVRPMARVFVALTATAAAALALIGGPLALSGGEGDVAMHQAQLERVDGKALGQAHGARAEHRIAPLEAATVYEPSTTPTEPAPPKDVAIAPTPAPVAETSPMVDAPPRERARSNAKAPSKKGPTKAEREQQLRELDTRAQAQWRAGDLRGASNTFAELTRLAGRSSMGDLAYGDRFTLARQMNRPDLELSLWREYLRRFPKGRFADDVLAGVCRRSSGSTQSQCWRDYLHRHKAGAHLTEANKVLRGKAE